MLLCFCISPWLRKGLFFLMTVHVIDSPCPHRVFHLHVTPAHVLGSADNGMQVNAENKNTLSLAFVMCSLVSQPKDQSRSSLST